ELNTDLKPGKGCHAVLNTAVVEFIIRAMDELAEIYTDERHDSDAKGVVADLARRPGWHAEKDNFGTKAILATSYPDGEFRITVVLTKRGELKLDIRPWISY